MSPIRELAPLKIARALLAAETSADLSEIVVRTLHTNLPEARIVVWHLVPGTGLVCETSTGAPPEPIPVETTPPSGGAAHRAALARIDPHGSGATVPIPSEIPESRFLGAYLTGRGGLDPDEQAYLSELASLAGLALDRLANLERGRTARTLVDNAPDGLFIAQIDGRYTDANARGLEMFGYSLEELQERRLIDLTDQVSAAPRVDLLLAGESVVTQRRFRRKDGSLFPGEITARMLPDGTFLGMVRDISDRLMFDRFTRQAQQLEVVGRLAGGVAHDFNNLLTVIIGEAEIAKLGLPEESPAHRALLRQQQACRLAQQMTRSLLAFSRHSTPEARDLAINDILRRDADILRRLLPEDVELDLDLQELPGSIHADPMQISLLLMNLVTNAADAVSDGGRITISTEAVAGQSERIELRRGRMVRLQVRDTGHGIAPDDLEHVFEPFFTTKEEGRGTGLGLSTVFSIVDGLDGLIDVDSTPGEGTTFSILLPRSDQPAQELDIEQAPVRDLDGSERILVVEDDDRVRAVICDVLRRRGYEVTEARRPSQGIAKFEAAPQAFDLIVSDVLMPEMSGPQMVERLQPERRACRVLFITGYADQWADVVARAGEGAVLPKPFTPRQLAERVRRTLSAMH